MAATLTTGRWLQTVVVLASAVAFGGLAGTMPLLALAIASGILLVALAFVAPVAHLTLLLFVAAVIPVSVQNIASGPGSLIVADVLLVTGVARASLVLIQHPLDRRTALALVVAGAFLLTVVLQFVHGLRLGRPVSIAGSELRAVIGFAAVLIALPILSDERARERLWKGLMLVGLALGAWGVAQWLLNIPFGAAGDVGVREGVAFTTHGRGQIQGGAYAFPIAVVLSFAALVSEHVRSRLARTVVLAIFLLNSVSLVLTFERAFWIGTAAGLLLVIARESAGSRARALVWTPAAVLLVAGVFTSIAPGQLTAASERLLSVREYENDGSLRYRIIESKHVWAEISERPVVGSGLAATIWWGRPAEGVPPRVYSYTHNGYLWVVWKLGLIGAALLGLLLALALIRRAPAGDGGSLEWMRRGAQAAVVVMLILGMTAPVFSTNATPLIGLLLALSLLPRRLLDA